MVVKEGWLKSTNQKALDLALKVQELGVGKIIYTDISRDGTLAGVRLDNVKQFIEPLKINVVVSGGVSDLKDIIALRDLKPKAPHGVIVGKAIYENRLDLRYAVSLCSRI
jgi:phosphoribosylformimino-5-aminoimidazole carboxamide ribotide isomerase